MAVSDGINTPSPELNQSKELELVSKADNCTESPAQSNVSNAEERIVAGDWMLNEIESIAFEQEFTALKTSTNVPELTSLIPGL